MNAYLSLGRWLFAIPLAVFGLIHFMNASQMAAKVPDYLPVPMAWALLAGTGLLAAAVAILLGKYDKLAATLLSVELLLFVMLVDFPAIMAGAGANTVALEDLLKGLSLSGGAMLYATYIAKDRSVVG